MPFRNLLAGNFHYFFSAQDIFEIILQHAFFGEIDSYKSAEGEHLRSF